MGDCSRRHISLLWWLFIIEFSHSAVFGVSGLGRSDRRELLGAECVVSRSRQEVGLRLWGQEPGQGAGLR